MRVQMALVAFFAAGFSSASFLRSRCNVKGALPEAIRRDDCSNFMTTTTFINPRTATASVIMCGPAPTKTQQQAPVHVNQDPDIPVIEVTHAPIPAYASDCSSEDYSRACEDLGIKSSDFASYGGMITEIEIDYTVCVSGPTPSPDAVWPELR